MSERATTPATVFVIDDLTAAPDWLIDPQLCHAFCAIDAPAIIEGELTP